ncbi:MAG: D-lyxose/D-mannose family sugar isomerase [Spirochaetaceae bacterium]|nr:D-lyxose/D-mannose family sugar isomerase [Spirochaetaceae bacterium]
MKRSEINEIIKKMEELLKQYKFSLPPFCKWTPEEWLIKNNEFDEIRNNKLGWDITDFGAGDFSKCGFALITLRNGNQNDENNQKVYAEKLIMLQSNQTAPLHFHWKKSEDIINRGGGTLLITLFNSNKEGEKLNSDVLVHTDGRAYYVKSGTSIKLEPGESITLYPYQYHSFATALDTEDILIGEVSQTNDDEMDNRFFEDLPRFPKIEEDVKPYRLLCNEYPEVVNN